jgi:hypothetical protein
MAIRILAFAERVGTRYLGIYITKLPTNLLGPDSRTFEPRGTGYRCFQLYVCHVNSLANRIGRINRTRHNCIFYLHW